MPAEFIYTTYRLARHCAEEGQILSFDAGFDGIPGIVRLT
jgi:hypothetical protein